MKIRALKARTEGKRRTSNPEHRTPQWARIRPAIRCSALDVRCWMLVRFMGKAAGCVHPRRNPPLFIVRLHSPAIKVKARTVHFFFLVQASFAYSLLLKW